MNLADKIRSFREGLNDSVYRRTALSKRTISFFFIFLSCLSKTGENS